MPRITRVLLGALALSAAFFTAAPAFGAGTLKPKNPAHQPIQIRDHHVDVVILNGFARTEVIQTFFNPNGEDLEAIYSFPLPKSASLSEVTIYSGEREIHGEVLPKGRARTIYREERDQGRDSGLAEKNAFYTFDFTVYPVRANGQTRIRFLYYQPITIDAGIGRYVYPLEEGGTDDAAQSFWSGNSKVEKLFSVKLELESAWPIASVRVPGFESEARVDRKDEGRYEITIEKQDFHLNRDLVFYYRLADNLPGRVELIPYRAEGDQPGTFMMVVTPGMDLKRLDGGADYTFVLDVSGSMRGKIRTLARGVVKALGELKDGDRFRIITFNQSARDLTGGWVQATRPEVERFCRVVEGLPAGGSTDVYEGLSLALSDLDDDRATSVVLVTDGVTNTGIVDPGAFHTLMKRCDVRVFGFLLGNSANWPLMRVVCEASGGFYAGVSNADDIVGQIVLAKSKVLHECMHDAKLEISGVKVFDTTDSFRGKVYRGQQLVVFGRYERAGRARITLRGRITGEDRTYTTEFDFPEVDTDHPELERLWALDRVEHIEHLRNIGQSPAEEARTAIRDLGVAYQLVTDETSMVVLTDEAFAERGIERQNRLRTAREHDARTRRAERAKPSGQPVRTRRVDEGKPMFDRSAPSTGGGSGGGAFDPASVGIAVGCAYLAARALRRRRRGTRREG